MSDFDKKLEALLSEQDEAYIEEALNETGFYSEVFDSLKGKGKGLYIMSWGGIFLASAGLIYCLIRMFQTTDLRQIILFATFAIMLNSAQIALKLWFNMRLNRQAMMRELKRLQLAIAKG